MKIIYPTHMFPKLSETFILEQITGLIDMGHNVWVIAFHPSDEPIAHPQVTEYNLLEHTIYVNRLPDDSGFDFTPDVVDLLHDADLIHAHFAAHSTDFALEASRRFGIPFIFTTHAYDIFVHTSAEKLAEYASAAARIITVTEYNKRYMLDLIGDEFNDKIDIIRCGIDVNRFTPMERPIRAQVTILTVGRFVEKKGIIYAVQAMAKLPADSNTILRIIGDGPLKSEIENAIRELNLHDKVILLGALPQSEVILEMQQADIFLLPSVTAANNDREGLPVVLLEAQAMELPVISTSYTGIPEGIIDGETGFLVPEKDHEALANRITCLESDPPLRRRMGVKGRDYISSNFNIVNETNKLSKLIHSVTTLKEGADRLSESKVSSLYYCNMDPNKTKVLCISHTSEFAGAEQSFLFMLENLNKDIFEPLIILPTNEGLLVDKIKALGLKYLIINSSWWLDVRDDGELVDTLLNEFSVAKVYAEIAKNNNIDLIYTNTIVRLAGAIAAKITNIPHIWHIRELLQNHQLNSLLGLDTTFKIIDLLSTKVICNSQHVASQFKHCGNNKLAVVYNAIDISKFSKLMPSGRFRSELGIDNPCKLIGIIGTVERYKNHELLLRAYSLICNNSVKSRLVIVGRQEPDYKNYLDHLMQSLGIEDTVIFVPFRLDMPEIFNELDVVVVASLAEPFGRTTIEAMAARKPVVATNTGASPEIVDDGITGYLVPLDDPEKMADAIIKIISNPDMAKDMGIAGQKRVQSNFTVENYISGIEDILLAAHKEFKRSSIDELDLLSEIIRIVEPSKALFIGKTIIEKIQTYQQSIIQNASQLAEQNQQILDRDQQLSALQLQFMDRGQLLTTIKQQLVDRDLQLTNLNGQLVDRDLQLTNLNGQLVNRDLQLTNLNGQLADRDQQLANINQQLVDRGHLVDTLDLQLKILNQLVLNKDLQISALLNSLSWKITWPLRYVYEILHLSPHEFIGKITSKIYLFSYYKYARFHLKEYYKKYGRCPRLTEIPKLITSSINNHYKVIASNNYNYNHEPQFNTVPAPTTFSQNSNLSSTSNTDSNDIEDKHPSTMDCYDAWIKVNLWNFKREIFLRKKLHEINETPLLSVIMPVYDPPVEYLNRAIASVYSQVYWNWELCIADDASKNGEVRTALMKWADMDNRIKLFFRESNGNISAATNSAATLSSGSHLVFLDQDDELTPDALGEIALYISANPETDIVYSDDDKIDTEGKRFAPQFKPDWSPELLLSYMYFSHIFVVSRKLFEELGGTRTGFEGAQDYDLALRASEAARHVGHIPLILYHWRVLPGSTAFSGKAKPDSMEAGRRAVQEALTRRGIQAVAYQPDWAKEAGAGIYSHRFTLGTPPKVSIIIPTKDQVKVLKRCVNSVLEMTDYSNFEILIIDNESIDPKTTEYFEKISIKPNVRVVKINNPDDGKFNYAFINNQAAESTDSDYALFLNNDTEVLRSDWLTQMVGYALTPGVGAVGARLLYPDRRIQHAGVLIKFYHGLAGHAFNGLSEWATGYLAYPKVLRNYSAVTAACLITPRALFKEIGGFDDKNFKVAYNDVDYCGRLLEKGYRVVYSPTAELIHHEGFSRGFSDDPRENANFREKYYHKKDKYYNPSLSLDDEHFNIWPRSIFTGNILKPIKTLMCSHNLNHEGAPHCLYEIAIALKKMGVLDPIVFSPSDGPLRVLFESHGIQIIIDENLGSIFDLEGYKARVNNFKAFITDLGVELVYANTLINFHAVAAAKAAELPSIWNIHESESWKHYQNWWGIELAEEASRCFAYPYKIVFVAHTTKDIYKPFEWKHNFHVIYNGLNLEKIYKEGEKFERAVIRKQLGIENDELAILLPGTICERKGQHDLARALSMLTPSCLKRIKCFIVGDWESPLPYSKDLHALADNLPLEAKKRLSILPITSEIFKFYKAADIFVCTSRIESFPLVILEAMAFNLPIITTPVFGIQEQVQEGINALFYPPGDHSRLAKSLEHLVTDDNMRKRFSANSVYVLRQLENFEEMVNGYATVFREAYLSIGPNALMPEGIHFFKAENTSFETSIRKVSFLTSYKDENSQRFRVYNLIEELRQDGVECIVIKEDFTGSLENVLDSDLIVAFRVECSENVRRILDQFQRRKVPTVFDIDDLVFEPESADLLHGLTTLGEPDRRKALVGLNSLRETLLLCDYATCTTKALCVRTELLGKTSFVIQNSINRKQFELAQKIKNTRKTIDGAKVRIGYFSGTKTHEKDFLEVSDALFEVMNKNLSVEFHLVGILDLDSKFSKFKDRVICQPLMDYLEMLQYLASMDINIAPLEMNNVFTACKSELKIFEAALLGIPTVASATDSYAGCITDGITGFLAASKDEWVEKLENFIGDNALRQKIAEQAKKEFIERFYIKNVIKDVINIYANICVNYKSLKGNT